MKNTIVVIMSAFILSACSGLSIKATTGQGEFKNKARTDRTEITVRKDLGAFHGVLKHEYLNSKAVDNQTHSLIDGNRTSVGLGVHTDKGTDLTALVNDTYWQAELMHRSDPIRWGLYPVLGITHLDAFGKKRKTTAAVVGVGYELSPRLSCEATLTTRNNTAEFVDDYVLSGCEYHF